MTRLRRVVIVSIRFDGKSGGGGVLSSWEEEAEEEEGDVGGVEMILVARRDSSLCFRVRSVHLSHSTSSMRSMTVYSLRHSAIEHSTFRGGQLLAGWWEWDRRTEDVRESERHVNACILIAST